MSNWSEKQTDDPHYADEHNFYKVEAWSRDDQHIVMMLYAGSSIDRARAIHTAARLRLGPPHSSVIGCPSRECTWYGRDPG